MSVEEKISKQDEYRRNYEKKILDKMDSMEVIYENNLPCSIWWIFAMILGILFWTGIVFILILIFGG